MICHIINTVAIVAVCIIIVFLAIFIGVIVLCALILAVQSFIDRLRGI